MVENLVEMANRLVKVDLKNHYRVCAEKLGSPKPQLN